MNVHGSAIQNSLITPYLFQQVFPGNGAASAFDEVTKQLVVTKAISSSASRICVCICYHRVVDRQKVTGPAEEDGLWQPNNGPGRNAVSA